MDKSNWDWTMLIRKPDVVTAELVARLSFDAQPHKHHEICLGDPRRASPEKLRTIISHPYAGGPR